MIMWRGQACGICGDLTRELVAIMSDHVKVEGKLADAIFVTKQFQVAREANAQVLRLIERRDELIGRLEAHRLAVHDDRTVGDQLSPFKHPHGSRELSAISTG
jgi:hypothetical protein